MLLGVAINVIKSIRKGVTLPKEINKLEKEYNKPIGDDLTEIERYYAKADLALTELYQSFKSSTKESKRAAINFYFSEMEKHMTTHQDLLNSTNATKFDIEKIAYSINELALLFDTNLDEFEKKSNSMMTSFSEISKNKLFEQNEEFANELANAKKKNAEIINSAKNEIHSMLINAENQLNAHKESIQKEITRIDDATKKQIAVFESKIQSQIDVEVSALDKDKEELRAEVSRLADAIRKSIDSHYIPLLKNRTTAFAIGLCLSILLGIIGILK